MSRYIDADKLKQDLGAWAINLHKPTNLVREDTFVIIDEQPAADVIEVVRCGECEYWKCNPNTDEYGVCKKVSYDDFEVVMDADDFCSYGEKKEQEHEHID